MKIMKIFNSIISIILIISLQACGVGTQTLLTNAGQSSAPAVGPSASKSIEAAEKAKKVTAEAVVNRLDVVIPTFDLGISEATDGEKGIWPELRRAEANLFAVELKKVLERTNRFGAVRVTPDRTAVAELYVMGRIDTSNGGEVEIDIAVADIAGHDLVAKKGSFNFSLSQQKPKLYGAFKTKSFSPSVEEKFFKKVRNKGQNPYQPVFDEVAAYVEKLVKALDKKRINDLRQLSDMRFAASFSEDAFSEYMQLEKGKYVVTGLPSKDDGIYRKVQAIRVRDQLFVDGLQNDYEQFSGKVAPSYRLWQEQTLGETFARRAAKKKATNEAIGAALLLGLAIVSAQAATDSNYNPVGDSIASAAAVTAGVVGIGLIGDSMKSSEEAKMHTEIIEELGESIEIEVAPKVVAFEEREKELVGNAKEQFAQWRAFLKTIYDLEKTPIKTL